MNILEAAKEKGAWHVQRGKGEPGMSGRENLVWMESLFILTLNSAIQGRKGKRQNDKWQKCPGHLSLPL